MVSNLVAEHSTNISFHGTVSQKSRHSSGSYEAEIKIVQLGWLFSSEAQEPAISSLVVGKTYSLTNIELRS